MCFIGYKLSNFDIKLNRLRNQQFNVLNLPDSHFHTESGMEPRCSISPIFMSMILIAKPGDELLYFSPTLLSIPNVLVLSLTTGSWNGDDWDPALEVRSISQFQSSRRKFDLGYYVIEDERLRFCPHMSFDLNIATNYLQAFVREHRIQEIFTYDGNSVTLELTRRNSALVAQRVGVRVYWMRQSFSQEAKFKLDHSQKVQVREALLDLYGQRYRKRSFFIWRRKANPYVLAS